MFFCVRSDLSVSGSYCKTGSKCLWRVSLKNFMNTPLKKENTPFTVAVFNFQTEGGFMKSFSSFWL
eukprot:UN11807